MIDRRIIKFKLRRGTSAELQYVNFEEGELVYTTDTRRVYVGDGRTLGGNLLANNISYLSGFPSSFTANDVLYRTDLGKMYIASPATINPWVFTGPYPDTTTIDFNNTSKLGVVSAGIKPYNLSYTCGNALSGINVSSLSGISVNINSSHFYFDVTGRLSIIPALTGSFIINPNFGGLSATGNGVGVKVDGSTLAITNAGGGNYVYVNQIDAPQIKSNAVNFRTLSGNVAAPLGGITLSANTGLVANIDYSTLKFTSTGKLAVDYSAFATYRSGLSGYQILPGGLTVWYGSFQNVTLSESTIFTVNFLPAFTQVYNMQITLGYSNPTTGSVNAFVKNLQNSYATIGVDLGYNTSSFSGNIYWMALGYN